MGLLSLNYDSLYIVVSFLESSDALHLSLGCKELYDLAHPQIHADVRLSSPAQVRRFWRWLRSDAHGQEHATEIKSLRFWAEPGITLDPEDGSVDDLRSRVLDILNAARGLHVLHINPLLLSYRDLRVGASIASLQHLVQLHLEDYDDAMLAVLRSLQSPLRVLKLSMSMFSRAVEAETPSLQAVLLAISQLRGSLRALYVHVENEAVPVPVPASRFTTFPALRLFRLIHPTRVPIDVYPLFPSLEVLKVSGINTAPQGRGAVLQRINYLQALPSEISVHAGRFPRVPYLHLLGKVQSSYEDNRQSYLDAIRRCCPTGLALTLSAGHIGPDFWSGLAQAAPRLRCLLLTLQLPRRIYALSEPDHNSIAFGQVLEDIASHMVNLPVSCLCVSTSYVFTRLDSVFERVRDLDVNDPAPTEHIDALARTIHAFPKRVADSLPNLRYLGLSQPGAKRDGCSSYGVIPDWHEDVYDADTLTADVRWWKVVQGGYGRWLRDVSPWEARGAWQSQLEDGRATLHDKGPGYPRL